MYHYTHAALPSNHPMPKAELIGFSRAINREWYPINNDKSGKWSGIAWTNGKMLIACEPASNFLQRSHRIDRITRQMAVDDLIQGRKNLLQPNNLNYVDPCAANELVPLGQIIPTGHHADRKDDPNVPLVVLAYRETLEEGKPIAPKRTFLIPTHNWDLAHRLFGDLTYHGNAESPYGRNATSMSMYCGKDMVVTVGRISPAWVDHSKPASAAIRAVLMNAAQERSQ